MTDIVRAADTAVGAGHDPVAPVPEDRLPDHPTPDQDLPRTSPVQQSDALLSRLHVTSYGLLLLGSFIGSVVLFAVIAGLKGGNPFDVLNSMAHSITSTDSLQQDLILTVPVGLGALAVAIPARAGLVNVGGEGQIIIGLIAACGVGLRIGAQVPAGVSWLLMSLAGMAAGAIWAGVCGLLRTLLKASEAVTTLLMNFLAADVMLYLILSHWGDGSGQTESKPLPARAVLPDIPGTDMHIGVLIAAAAAVLAWFLLQRTSWGFALRVVGGNGEAARRAGLNVTWLLVSSMLVGGALAGLGGALHLAGVATYQLRPDMTATYGYIGFLASFLGRGRPGLAIASAFVFSAITLSGPNLESDVSQVPKTIVSVLLALVVAAPFVIAKYRRKSA
jgi:simple sugar transport system permease protein